MVAAFDYCLHGKGGAAPSIDTAMHGLVDAPHVDHLHPDSGIALACAADGEKLTAECFGDTVVWVPWRRPGFQLGLDIAAVKEANPQAIGCILGGHGITAWGETAEECERNSLHIIRAAEAFLAERGKPEPFGPHAPRFSAAAAPAERRARRGRTGPVHPRAGLPGPAADRPLRRLRTWSSTSCRAPSTRGSRPSAPPAPTTSCARRSGPLRPRPARRPRPWTRRSPGCGSCTPPTARSTRAYYAAARRPPDSPADARRGPGDRPRARRRHVQLRQGQADRAGGGRVLHQRDQRDAGRRGRLVVRAHRRVGEVPDRVLGAGGGQAATDAEAQAAGHPRRTGDRSGLAASAGRSRTGWSPRAPAWWWPTSNAASATRWARSWAGPTRRSPSRWT